MTFENYLQRIHGEIYMGTDDDMPDAFDAWVSELEADEVMKFAEAYGKQLQGEGK